MVTYFSIMPNPKEFPPYNRCLSVVCFHFQSVFTRISKKGNAKECLNDHTVMLIWHASKVMLQILQARLQQYVTQELPDLQAGFRKGRRTRDQIVSICWIIKKAKEFQENIYFCFTNYAKAIVWITQPVENS